jgi:histidinol-phosphate phosphatase family protein
MAVETRRAILLDRDGVIVRDTGYIRAPAGLELLPGAAESIARLRAAGYLCIVVSNQSGVARGIMTMDEMLAVQRALDEMLAPRGAALDAAYFCPHHPTEGSPPFRTDCPCRKPKPGLILRAAREWAIDLGKSWMIGDSERDAQAGRFAGVKSLLVGPKGAGLVGVRAFATLGDAANHILKESAG